VEKWNFPRSSLVPTTKPGHERAVSELTYQLPPVCVNYYYVLFSILCYFGYQHISINYYYLYYVI